MISSVTVHPFYRFQLGIDVVRAIYMCMYLLVFIWPYDRGIFIFRRKQIHNNHALHQL